MNKASIPERHAVSALLTIGGLVGLTAFCLYLLGVAPSAIAFAGMAFMGCCYLAATVLKVAP